MIITRKVHGVMVDAPIQPFMRELLDLLPPEMHRFTSSCMTPKEIAEYAFVFDVFPTSYAFFLADEGKGLNLDLETCLNSEFSLQDEQFRASKNLLSQDCECWTCKRHNAGYIFHLFDSHEMLGYILLTMYQRTNIDIMYIKCKSLWNKFKKPQNILWINLESKIKMLFILCAVICYGRVMEYRKTQDIYEDSFAGSELPLPKMQEINAPDGKLVWKNHLDFEFLTGESMAELGLEIYNEKYKEVWSLIAERHQADHEDLTFKNLDNEVMDVEYTY